MKQSRILLLLILASLTGVMIGCKERVDFNDIDTRSQVGLGIALPIGSLHVTLGDLTKTNTFGNKFYIAQDGTLTYRDTTHYTKEFHDINWDKYVSKSSKTFVIDPTLIPGGVIPGGVSHTFTFPFTMELSEVNKDLTKERFDSILVASANWSSMVDKRNLDELQWEWIDKMSIDLGTQCYRPAGSKVDIYVKEEGGGNFGQTLDMQIKDFSICLMKDRGLDPTRDALDVFNNNVISSVTMTFMVTVTIPQDKSLTIQEGSAFLYNAKLQMLEHKAIWGYVCPNEDMTIRDTLDLLNDWELGSLIHEMQLPFYEPSIQLDMRSQISTYWEMTCDSTYAYNSQTRDQMYATFNGATSRTEHFEDKLGLDVSSLGQEATYSSYFDKTEKNGCIDKWFSISPDRLVYKYAINLWDPEHHPQMRIPTIPQMTVDMISTLPMAFNQIITIATTDTLRNVNLSKLTLDSLLSDVKQIEDVKQASVYLVIKGRNEIPLDVHGELHFLDKDKQPLPVTTQTLQFAALDTSTNIIKVEEADLDYLVATKSIFIDITADDKPLRDKPNLYPIRLMDTQGLTLTLGFAGNAEAVLNFNNKNK